MDPGEHLDPDIQRSGVRTFVIDRPGSPERLSGEPGKRKRSRHRKKKTKEKEEAQDEDNWTPVGQSSEKKEFQYRAKVRAAGNSVKLEVAAGDFSVTANHSKSKKGEGDVITEFLTGKSPGVEPEWKRNQEKNIKKLRKRGARALTGVDMTDPMALKGAVENKQIGKIKAENLHGGKKDDGENKKNTGDLLGQFFDSAGEALAENGVVLYGLTGPMMKEEFIKLSPVFDAANEKGFEVVGVRSNRTARHTFTGQGSGINDHRRIQLEFARKDDAEKVRTFNKNKKWKVKENKQRYNVKSGKNIQEITGMVAEHHGSLNENPRRNLSPRHEQRGSSHRGGRSHRRD